MCLCAENLCVYAVSKSCVRAHTHSLELDRGTPAQSTKKLYIILSLIMCMSSLFGIYLLLRLLSFSVPMFEGQQREIQTQFEFERQIREEIRSII